MYKVITLYPIFVAYDIDFDNDISWMFKQAAFMTFGIFR